MYMGASLLSGIWQIDCTLPLAFTTGHTGKDLVRFFICAVGMELWCHSNVLGEMYMGASFLFGIWQIDCTLPRGIHHRKHGKRLGSFFSFFCMRPAHTPQVCSWSTKCFFGIRQRKTANRRFLGNSILRHFSLGCCPGQQQTFRLPFSLPFYHKKPPGWLFGWLLVLWNAAPPTILP